MLPYFHQTQTRNLLKKQGFSDIVTSIVSEASKWPDSYRWTNHASHAQSPSGSDGLPHDIKQAQNDCSGLLREYIETIRNSEPNERLVWLGFALHLVQDLAVHQGRTKNEHAWNALLWFPNPDWSLNGLRQGAKYIQHLIQHIEKTFPTEEYQKLRAGIGVRSLLESERTSLLGPRNYSRRSLIGFIPVGLRYPFIQDKSKRARWDTEQVLRDGLR